jgi:hypothetical protein
MNRAAESAPCPLPQNTIYNEHLLRFREIGFLRPMVSSAVDMDDAGPKLPGAMRRVRATPSRLPSDNSTGGNDCFYRNHDALSFSASDTDGRISILASKGSFPCNALYPHLHC